MTTPATVPSPAALPGAGLSLTESLRRRETAEHAVAEILGPLAPPGALEQLAAEQGVEPVESVDEFGPPAGTFTEAESQAFHTAIRDRGEPTTRPVPQPPTWRPQPVPLTREQYIRKFCLEAAIRYFTGLNESSEDDVFAAAKDWAEWIRTGT